MADLLASKDPRNIEPYFIIWCDPYGSNRSGDNGELQGATITTSVWAMPTGSLVKTADNLNAVTIDGVVYAVNTVSTVWVASGTAGNNYTLTNTVVLSDSRTLDWSIIIPVSEH